MQHASAKHMRISDSKDFVVRKHGPSLAQIFVVCLAVLTAAIVMTMSVNDREALLALLFILAGCTSWYVTNQVRQNRELLQATEFQNALFSSALGAHHKFCMIVRKDKNIVYFDRSFQQHFPDFIHQDNSSMEQWLKQNQGSEDDGARVLRAIEQGGDARVECRLKDASGQPQNTSLIIEPILRPSGFILLRGSAPGGA